MKRVIFSVLAAALSGVFAAPAWAQTATASASGAPSTVNRSGAPADVQNIIRTFGQKESEVRRALSEYSFKRDAVIQTIAFGGQISGEYRRVSRFLIDEQGHRMEKILFFPIPTLSEITITPEDLEDLGGVNLFALEASKLNEYDFAYVGKEKIDDLNLHVFDVTPKILSDQARLKTLKKAKKFERFFQGRIWVDDQDFQIVKARGKGVPEFDQRFPTFESYRQQVDGKHWFPTYTYADDELVFKSGQTIRIRMKITFDEFERLRGKARVVEEGQPGETEKPGEKPAPTPEPNKTKP